MKESEIEARKAKNEAEREARKKSLRLKIRVTEEEKKHWTRMARSTGLTLSGFVRESIGRVHTWSAGDRKLYAARTREIARIGNNLNLIARWASMNPVKGSESAQIIIALSAISEALMSFTFVSAPTSNSQAEVESDAD